MGNVSMYTLICCIYILLGNASASNVDSAAITSYIYGSTCRVRTMQSFGKNRLFCKSLLVTTANNASQVKGPTDLTKFMIFYNLFLSANPQKYHSFTLSRTSTCTWHQWSYINTSKGNAASGRMSINQKLTKKKIEKELLSRLKSKCPIRWKTKLVSKSWSLSFCI